MKKQQGKEPKMSPQEIRGHMHFKSQNYSGALKAYTRALNDNPKPTVELFQFTVTCLTELYKPRLTSGMELARFRELTNERDQKIERCLKQGLEFYPKDFTLWRRYAYLLEQGDDRERFFDALLQMIEFAQTIATSDVESIFSPALFWGRLDICKLALTKYLADHEPYLKIALPDPANTLAELFVGFGDLIVPEAQMKTLIHQWDTEGYWMSSGDFPNESHGIFHTAFLCQREVQEWIIALREFGDPYLDGVRAVLQGMIGFLDQPFEEAFASLSARLTISSDERINRLRLLLIEEASAPFFVEEDVHVEEVPLPTDLLPIIMGRLKDARGDKEEDPLALLIRGAYTKLSETSRFNSYLLTGKEGRSLWSRIVKLLHKGKVDEAIALIQGHMRRTREGDHLYFFRTRTLLFGLLYASGRFEEAHTLALEWHPFLGALPETYRTYIKEMAQYQKESTPSPVEDQAKLARKALEGIDGLTDYLTAYPNDGRAMLIRFTEAPQRFYEEEEIAQFVNYLFLRGAECLDESDNDQGAQKILAYLTLERSQIRAQLPQETFDRIWKIIYLLRRIERMIGKGALQAAFQKCLDSDDDFTTVVARDMLLHEWWTDQEVVKTHRDFLLWITTQRLGIGAYYSNLFSPQPLEAQARQKKRTRRVDVEAPALETESLIIRDPIGEWEFFVSAHDTGDFVILPHSKEAFDTYFKNQFVVSGEGILKKLQYFLMHEEYQRNIFPPLVTDIYKGYRKLKVAGVRIFWKLDSQQKKLCFFVKNRRDAYR